MLAGYNVIKCCILCQSTVSSFTSKAQELKRIKIQEIILWVFIDIFYYNYQITCLIYVVKPMKQNSRIKV